MLWQQPEVFEADRMTMDTPDYEQTRKILLETNDQQVIRLVRVMDAVFRRSRFRPGVEVASREGEVIAAVRAVFPTPFARQFATWADYLDAELREALAGWSAVREGDARSDDAERKLRLRFRAASLQLETCWKQIVHFLPFIFIASLRRLDDEVLRRDVARELARALRNYNAFYVRYDIERQKEAVQYHLLISLLKLFRQLTERKGLGDDFLFAALMKEDHPSLNDIFPERFDAGMLFLQEVRNRLTHGGLTDRLPVEAIEPVSKLIRWCFLDIVSILAVPCRAFSLSFVVESRASATETDVLALDFSGVTGPSEVRYRVNREWQPEEYAFLPYRIYLVSRHKRMGSGTGEMLTPRDYLDLTPFLIVDRLRSASARPGPLPVDRQQLLFALQQYLEPMRQLLFSDLGGSGDRIRPSDPRDSEADLLLRQMGDFRNRYRSLVEQVTLGAQKRLSAPDVRSQLWRISKDHLATLMDTESYDENGALVAERIAAEMRTVYVEELFVEPTQSEAVVTFFGSNRRGLVLVGDSGAGKSNLLVRHYLARLRAGELAVFLTGRRLESPSFAEALVSKVVSRISDGWSSLENLGDFLDENGEMLTVFVDALNEYSGPQGARSLLESLISAVGSDNLRRIKVVASTRSETWAQYRAHVGTERPLDADLFFTADGDAVRLGRFETVELCDKLYGVYRDYYRLRPATFKELSAPVRALIAQPFMMGMIAETYSNRLGLADEGMPREIPADLDYYSIFVRLTERKARDAQILVSTANLADRDNMPGSIEVFCELLAEMIFERLTSEDLRVASGRDALPIDSVSKRPELERFVQNRYSISVLEAVLQIGLLERIAIPQRNREGRLVTSAAFKFFHDQYTQYCLAAAYQQKILGWLHEARLADPAQLSELIRKIESIVMAGVAAPILVGALDHWLQKNIVNFHEGQIAPIVPLLNGLVEDGSPAVRHVAVALVTNLILRGSIPAPRVYGAIFRKGSPKLRLSLVDAFVAFWPQLPPAALHAFIDACDPRRDFEVLDRLGDVFALRIAAEPQQVADYLGKAVRPLSFASIAEPMRIRRQSRFALQVTIFSVFSCFDQPAAMQAVRQFVRSKYRSVLDLVDETERGSAVGRIARRTLRQLLSKLFDSFGVAQWNKFIAAMEPSGNDRFFVDNDGVIQHDLLARFLPFVVDLHNGETERLSLAEGTQFRDIALRMLDFRPASVIGYNAVIALPSILVKQDFSVARSLVMELIGRRTPSAIFHGQLLLSNLSFSDHRLALPSLELLRDRIIPPLLEEGAQCDWSMSFCVASLDVQRLWPVFEGLLEKFFAHFDKLADARACGEFGDHLYKVCYCGDITLGRNVIALMLRDRRRFLGPLWRSCTMKVFAAMLARSPATLTSILATESGEDDLVREARNYQTAEIVKQSRLFPFQVDVNRFVAWLFVAEPRLRYAIIKYFIGSLAMGSSVEDFPPGVRQTMVALINVFFGDHPEAAPQGNLSVAEIATSVAATRGRRRAA